MARIKKIGKEKGRRRSVLFCLFSFALLAACGCTAANKNKGDPLLGEFGPKGEVKTPPAKTSSNPVPPIPTATAGINNATLASGTLPGSQTLAISQPPPNSDNGPGSLTAAARGANNTVLSKPEPILQQVPREDAPVVPAGNWGKDQPPPPDPILMQQPLQVSPPPGQQPAVDLVFAQFKAQLQTRGIAVSNYRVDPVAGGVKFSCLVPNPQNPQVTRAYEAIGPDYPTAVRAVLWEIDNKR